jgi:hypothetical protein
MRNTAACIKATNISKNQKGIEINLPISKNELLINTHK